jgi:hypothetical protein
MACEWLAANLPGAGTVAGAVISVAAAIGTAVLAYQKSRLLESQKNDYQRDLEGLKNQLQQSLESRKLDLQKELEEFKAGIADDTAARNARRGYEYDARKRLYEQVEPLLFQLFEAAEGAFHAVASLARTQRKNKLPEWLGPEEDEYYIRSIIHRLFRPLAIYRLLQRSTTLVDLTLDPTIRLRYSLLKECYLTWTDDFTLKDLAPTQVYDPNVDDWEKLRKSSPAVYWRQALVIGDLDRLIDSMTVTEGSSLRIMNFGEFDTAAATDKKFKTVFDFPRDVFEDFSFPTRPVLSRMLLSYACLMHILMTVYAGAKMASADEIDLQAILADFLKSEESQALNWRTNPTSDDMSVICPYVLRRIEQARQGGYVKF